VDGEHDGSGPRRHCQACCVDHVDRTRCALDARTPQQMPRFVECESWQQQAANGNRRTPRRGRRPEVQRRDPDEIELRVGAELVGKRKRGHRGAARHAVPALLNRQRDAQRAVAHRPRTLPSVRAWTAIPRGYRARLERLLPGWSRVWLHQLREIEVDRHFTAGQTLVAAYPELAARVDPQTAFNRSECRVYSQNGEDGILLYLFSRIGTTDRRFIEFGIGDGSECNTANLATAFGWRGLLMEADPDLAVRAREFFATRPTLRSSGVRVEHARVEPETIDVLVRGFGIEGELDLLSIDIDGNDYWVWRATEAVSARVVVIEYNASFGPTRSVTVPYRPGFNRYVGHVSGFYHGASLRALSRLAKQKGYVLAGCDSRGTNAFFVRQDSAAGKIEPVAVEDAFFPLYERAHLTVEEQFRTIQHLELVEVE
jgi:hypothetical protein